VGIIMDIEAVPMQLESVGEFGSELILFLPFCRWLSANGFLRERRLLIYRGMRCLYDKLDCNSISEKKNRRRYVPPERRPRWLPILNEHDFDGKGTSPFLIFDDLRSSFCARRLFIDKFLRQKDVLIIHNKYNKEWGEQPVNFIPLSCLDEIFTILKDKFHIIYIRHTSAEMKWGFSSDCNVERHLDDASVLAMHPEVLDFRILYMMECNYNKAIDINTLKIRYIVVHVSLSRRKVVARITLPCFLGQLCSSYIRKGKRNNGLIKVVIINF
jgi:hypothetical protein